MGWNNPDQAFSEDVMTQNGIELDHGKQEPDGFDQNWME